jgi:predicted small secreted protein
MLAEYTDQRAIQGDRNMTRKWAVIAVTATALLVTGCNTVKGLGRDIESVGEAGEKVVK